MRVEDVAQGSESELRHFLESVVLQANTDASASEPQVADTQGESSIDERMTREFRSFAGENG